MKFYKFTMFHFKIFTVLKTQKNYKKLVMVAHGKKQIKIQVMRLER